MLSKTPTTFEKGQSAGRTIKNIQNEKDKKLLILEYIFRPPNDEEKHYLERMMWKRADDAFFSSASATRKEIVELFFNPKRMNAPGLSLRRLLFNIRKLSERITVPLLICSYFSHALSWDSPSKTLTCLVLYTWGVWYPQLFLIYPILAIIFTIIIPNYLLRHEIYKPRFGNGQLIQNLNPLGDPLVLGFLTGGDRQRQQLWKKMLTSDDVDKITDEELANFEFEPGALMAIMSADSPRAKILKMITGGKAETQDNDEDNRIPGIDYDTFRDVVMFLMDQMPKTMGCQLDDIDCDTFMDALTYMLDRITKERGDNDRQAEKKDYNYDPVSPIADALTELIARIVEQKSDNDAEMLTKIIDRMAETKGDDDAEKQAVKEDENKNLKKSIKTLHSLSNMKDLQNLTADFSNFLALIEDKVEKSCTFKDEKKTTILFYELCAVIVFLLVIGMFQ
ncbi:unnamed protein product [Ambrosiozyma monospora]|uniref:Unnamed protein product n=1 Tax=Ambrosiozyma monospora TaxID=43982 RepID=A0A9W6Z246_AMBMO|nr:unnamed protein product [Ambrosiozyma monospora]